MMSHRDLMAKFWEKYISNSSATVKGSINQAVLKKANERCRHPLQEEEMTSLFNDSSFSSWLCTVAFKMFQRFDSFECLHASRQATELDELMKDWPIMKKEQQSIVSAAIDDYFTEEIPFLKDIRTRICECPVFRIAVKQIYDAHVGVKLQ
jgi:hypothetical protein